MLMPKASALKPLVLPLMLRVAALLLLAMMAPMLRAGALKQTVRAHTQKDIRVNLTALLLMLKEEQPMPMAKNLMLKDFILKPMD